MGNTATKPINTDVTHQLPSHFEGWIIGSHKGFIKLHKRINGKVRSIYIGKVWDDEKAKAKIRAIASGSNVTQCVTYADLESLPSQAVA